jgi:hypothetical protein
VLVRCILRGVSPTAPLHLDILRKICARFLFVSGGQVAEHPTFSSLAPEPEVRSGLGAFLLD